MANYKDNPNKNLSINDNKNLSINDDIHVRMHVFEPDESINKEDWYKDMATFSNMGFIRVFLNINTSDIVEDNTGARFRILSKHWKWDKDGNGIAYPVLEFTAERYMRRGKQNPYMF